MNKNIYIICNLLICFSLLSGCAKSPLNSETEQNRAGFNLLMNEGDPNLGNEAIFDNMRLYCFTQGIETEIHNPEPDGPPISPNPNTDNGFNGSGGSWNSQFSHELYNITRSETALNTNTAKAGLWDLVMVSSSGAELTPPLSSKKSSESLMYTYNPGPDGSQSQAHEIWYRMLRLPMITANTDQSASGAITRNMAMIKVVVDRAVDIDLTSTDHQFKLHNVPDKISWSGTLLRTTDNGGYETSLTNPDVLAEPLTGKFTFTPHSTEPNVYKSDELTFIIPAHRETDFWTDNVTPIEKAQDTLTHKLSLSVSFAKASGGKFEKTAVIENRVIRCNGILLVCLKMKDVDLELTTSIAPWGEEPVSGDFEAPYLTVSETKTTTYDGAASRIYFNTNVPDDSVYIEPKAGDNTGVDDIFDRITGPDAANRAYDETKKSGYIDIACLDAAWPPSGSDPLPPVKITLKAGSLRREITVNRSGSVQLSKNVATPYIGTFHRWNQVGERLVTWAHEGPWTATIDNPESGILIDRLPSPAFSDNTLYSSNDNPSDAEIGIITSDATSVSGMDRIYFRVGWKTKLGSADAEPRYATITVRQGNGVEQKIYCRQGEKAVAVYPRSGAARFSPYNLTSGSPATTDVSVRGGIFTDYPTQAGRHFQWVSLDNPRRAYAVYGTGTPAWGVTTPYHEPFWAEGNPRLEQNHETCPPGYRRVSDGGTADEPTNASGLRQSLWATPSQPSNGSGDAANVLTGFYADGFFDRRATKASATNAPNSAVQTDVSNKTAYCGKLFFNEATGASLFFPFGGQRTQDGGLQHLGTQGMYWSASATADEQETPGEGTSAYITLTVSRHAALSIRCVAE